MIHTHATTEPPPLPPVAAVKKPFRKNSLSAALAEYGYYKRTGNLAAWREKWRHVLNLRPY